MRLLKPAWLNHCRPTSWPYRLWPLSNLWRLNDQEVFGVLKSNCWEWSGRLKLPLWLRLWTWLDTDVARNMRLAQRFSRARKTCAECEVTDLPAFADYCCYCGEELYDDDLLEDDRWITAG